MAAIVLRPRALLLLLAIALPAQGKTRPEQSPAVDQLMEELSGSTSAGRWFQKKIQDLDAEEVAALVDRLVFEINAAFESPRKRSRSRVPLHVVIHALATIGSEARPAVPRLIDVMRRGWQVGAVARALGEIGDPRGVSALSDVLKTSPPRRKTSIIRALGEIGPAAAPAVDAICDEYARARADPTTRSTRVVVEALGRIRANPGRSLQVLEGALFGDDRLTRSQAAEALEAFGPDAAPAIPALLLALNDDSIYTRRNAVKALAAIGEPAVSKLLPLLRVHSEELRYRAAEALGRIGSPALPYLIVTLRSPSKTARRAAANAISRMGEEAESAIDPLVDLLASDPDDETRRAVTVALGSMGHKAERALPALVAHLDPFDPVTALAIARMAPSGHPLLLEQATAGETSVRAGLALTIGIGGYFQSTDEKELEAVARLLADPEYVVRVRVARSLGRLSPESRPFLRRALEAERSEVREAALHAFSFSFAHEREDLRRVAERLEDPVAAVRREAIFPLRFTNAPDGDGLVRQALDRALEDPDPTVRYQAAMALADRAAMAEAREKWRATAAKTFNSEVQPYFGVEVDRRSMRHRQGYPRRGPSMMASGACHTFSKRMPLIGRETGEARAILEGTGLFSSNSEAVRFDLAPDAPMEACIDPTGMAGGCTFVIFEDGRVADIRFIAGE